MSEVPLYAADLGIDPSSPPTGPSVPPHALYLAAVRYDAAAFPDEAETGGCHDVVG